MRALLAVSRWIDAATRMIGQSVAWLIVVAALISGGNALVRKVFDISSNAWLELQWWLFAAVFLLAAPWTLALNEHIRIDIVNERLSPLGAQRHRDHRPRVLPAADGGAWSPTRPGLSSLPRTSRTSSRRTSVACRSGR